MITGKYTATLRPGFQSFLWTQFLGAFNNHVYRIIFSLLTREENGCKTERTYG